jgi:hypothetical protein
MWPCTAYVLYVGPQESMAGPRTRARQRQQGQPRHLGFRIPNEDSASGTLAEEMESRENTGGRERERQAHLPQSTIKRSPCHSGAAGAEITGRRREGGRSNGVRLQLVVPSVAGVYTIRRAPRPRQRGQCQAAAAAPRRAAPRLPRGVHADLREQKRRPPPRRQAGAPRPRRVHR